MKKLAILFLLATVLVSFSFAQVWVKGGFEAPNVTGANSGDADPILYTEFGGSASTDLGPGSIGVELQLGAGLHFSEDAATAAGDAYGTHGDVYLKGKYSLAAGPGTLAIGISTWSGFNSIAFGVDYDGIAAGPATLGLGVEYALNTSGSATNSSFVTTYGPFKDDPKTGDVVTARVGLGIAGFSLTYKLKFTLNATNAVGDDESWISTIAYIDAAYQVIDPLKVGVEVDNTGAAIKDGDYFKGFSVKPYVEYAISEKTSAGASVVIGNIGNDAAGNDEIEINPGLWIKYAF